MLHDCCIFLYVAIRVFLYIYTLLLQPARDALLGAAHDALRGRPHRQLLPPGRRGVGAVRLELAHLPQDALHGRGRRARQRLHRGETGGEERAGARRVDTRDLGGFSYIIQCAL